MVEAHARRDVGDVCAHELAHVRDLVDEAHARREECVRGQLHHLRRGHARTDDRRVETCVEGRNAVAVRLLERTDHDPVRPHEACDRRSLREELGVRDVSDAREPACVESRPDRGPGPDGNGALHNHDRPLDVEVARELVDHGPDRRQVSVSRVRRRRSHRDEEELGALDRLRDVEGEGHALAVALDELLEARLEDRHPALVEHGDPILEHIAQNDFVTELREAGTGDEADVSGAEDRDVHGYLTFPSGRRPLAIASIVSFDMLSSSVLITQ